VPPAAKLDGSAKFNFQIREIPVNEPVVLK